jgi:hypothetical protein
MGRLLRSIAAPAALLALAGSAHAAPAPLEPVALERLPMPPGVGSMSFPDWTPDGGHVVFGFTSSEQPDAQLGLIADDGSGFRCLSCGLEQVQGLDRPFNATRPLALDKPYVFGDGKRVLTRIVGEREDRGGANPLAGPTQDFNFAILECAPSLLECRDKKLLALNLPGGGLTRGVQNREGRISPDSQFFAWTEVMADGTRMSLGRLVRAEDHYELADVRVLNPPFELRPPDPSGFALGGPLYELKNFAPDGRTVTYASFAEAENYDVWELDLATGARRRLTYDREWNEGTTRSPDNRSFVNFSSRTRDRMAPFALLPRPPFIDFATYVLTGRFALNRGNRKCLLSPWLLDGGGERGTYFGQPIDPDPPEGFASHGNGPFSPDGTKIAFWEFDDDAAGTPQEPDAHLVVARLPARRPRPLREPPRTPYPMWAVPRADWDGYGDTTGVYTVNGPGGGTATIRLAGLVNSMDWSVEYARYSEDGRSFLDGTEAVSSPFTIAYGRWTADLRMTGERPGLLRADVEVRTGGQATGSLVTDYGGRRLEGLPKPECTKLETPALRVRRARGRRGRLVVRVTSRVTGDAVSRPVRGATVTVGRRTARTGQRGIARLRKRRGRRAFQVQATAPGFIPATRPMK